MTRASGAGGVRREPAAAGAADAWHLPVMVEEVVRLFEPAAGGLIVDCTVGGGGHAEALLARLDPPARLVGIDRDAEALGQAATRLQPFADRGVLVHRSFEDLDAVMAEEGCREVDGILFDLGVSSAQLDLSARGFSFRHDGPLDMRMDTAQTLTAGDVVNSYEPAELERVIRRYGEERYARRITRAICQARPVGSTRELAEVVSAAIPAPARRTGGHPARRTFQAIRIEVNGELRAVEIGLAKALRALRSPGGRVVVLSYHSLEDRIAKAFVAENARGCSCPPGLPVCGCGTRPLLRPLTRRVVRPSAAEVKANPRAEAAKLRGAERTGEAIDNG